MKTLRIANFMDSPLESLERKGNLSHAVALYNPLGRAETVVHFTPFQSDLLLAPVFADARVEIFAYCDGRAPKWRQIVSLPATLMRAVGKIRRDGLTVVRGRLPYFGSLVGCLAARVLGLPCVVSMGGDNRLPQEREGRFYFGSRWLSYHIEEWVLRLASRVIVPNAFTKRYVVKLIGDAAQQKIEVIPWILESALAAAPPALSAERLVALGINPTAPYVLVVGHLNRYKFSTEMFTIAAELHRRRQDAQVVFCGDGPLRAAGESQLRGSSTLFTGWQPNADVLALARGAAAVLVPMSGFVLLEAAWLGAAVLTSNVEWHSEIVTDSVTGWTLDPADTNAWCDRLEWILDHPQAARDIGARLAQTFIERYAPDRAIQQELAVYERLLSQ